MKKSPAQAPTTMPMMEPMDSLDELGEFEDDPVLEPSDVPSDVPAVGALAPGEVVLGGEVEPVLVAGMLIGDPAAYDFSPQYRE
jgi:hypothetical protein